MYTVITMRVIDQTLQLTNEPHLASGDQNSVKLQVTFDAVWDTYAKSAVFFTEQNHTVYEMVLNGDSCVIPHEVLAEAGTLYIGFRGVNADNAAVKTTALAKYNLVEGAPAGTGTVVEPSPDVYQQLLGLIQETMDATVGMSTHIADEVKHITAEERASWDASLQYKGATTNVNALTEAGIYYAAMGTEGMPERPYAHQIIMFKYLTPTLTYDYTQIAIREGIPDKIFIRTGGGLPDEAPSWGEWGKIVTADMFVMGADGTLTITM